MMRKLFFILIISVILAGCSENLADNTINTHSNYSKISFEQFKKETGLKEFNTTLKTNIKITSKNNIERNYEFIDFTISTSAITRLVNNQKTTYTFRVFPNVPYQPNEVFNLTVYFKNGWQMIILKIDNLQIADKQITKIYETDSSNSSKSCSIVSVESHHCTNTGSCASGTCDGCNYCVDYDMYTFCSNNSTGPNYNYLAAAPGGGPGGGS